MDGTGAETVSHFLIFPTFLFPNGSLSLSHMNHLRSFLPRLRPMTNAPEDTFKKLDSLQEEQDEERRVLFFSNFFLPLHLIKRYKVIP